jgi:TonB family protein
MSQGGGCVGSREPILWVLVCFAAGGCATTPSQRASEAVFDCPRIAAPMLMRPQETPAGPSVRPLDTTLDMSQLANVPDSAGSPQDLSLDTAHPRLQSYFAEIKRRIWEKWSYPSEAARRGQSGSGELQFLLHKDGWVKTVKVVNSSGVRLLDSYIENAVPYGRTVSASPLRHCGTGDPH